MFTTSLSVRVTGPPTGGVVLPAAGGLIAIVDELYVAPPARGCGLGTAFFAALAAGAIPPFRELVAIDLEVSPKNTRARDLYGRLGFAPQRNAMLRSRLPSSPRREAGSS